MVVIVEVVMIVGEITTMMEAGMEIMIIEMVVVEVVHLEVVEEGKMVGMVKFLLQPPLLMVQIIHLLLMHMVKTQIMEWKLFLQLQAILVDPHHTLHTCGGPAGGYGSEGLSDVRTDGRGSAPGGYDSGYGSGGPRNQGDGYDGPPVDTSVKIKQCDGNCGDSCDNSRIYISNLPPDVTIEELRDLFGGIGQVGRIKQKRGYKDQWPWNIKIYTDEEGNQKGDAVLSYEDPQAAHSAGNFFNNHVMRGYAISVAMAEKTAPKVYDHGGGRGG